MRKMFQQIDTDNNGTIDKAEFTAACTKMQVTDSHVVDMIYSETDMNHDQQVDFKEFILMIACLYLTADIKTDEGNTIANALNKVLEAFMFFDSDNDGFIEKSEVTKVLNESTPVGGNGSDVLTSARFEEMDWDHNARVSFKEFLFAVESWVGLDEEDED